MPWPLQFLCDTFTTAFAAAMAAVGGDSEVPSDIDDLSVTTQLMMTALTSKACEVRDASRVVRLSPLWGNRWVSAAVTCPCSQLGFKLVMC